MCYLSEPERAGSVGGTMEKGGWIGWKKKQFGMCGLKDIM